MAVLVNIPKREIDIFLEEKCKEGVTAWWKLPCMPPKSELTGGIFFQFDKKIIAFAPIIEVKESEEVCEETGRVWKGVNVFWKGEEVSFYNPPRPGTNLVRGFTYYHPRWDE